MTPDKDRTSEGRRVTVSVDADIRVPFDTSEPLIFRGETVLSDRWVDMRIDVDATGEPTLELIRPRGRPLTIDEMERTDWRKTIADAYYNEAIRAWRPDFTGDPDKSFDQLFERADAARTRRRRRGLTPAELDQVAEAYRAGKAEEVARRMNVGLRQATRYIGAARAKGQL